MIRAGLVGGGPGPLAGGYPWRLLRLGDALDATWQGPGAARVTNTAQDADGWIEMDLANPSPSGLDAYRRWVLRDLAGFAVDDPSGGRLLVRLEVDWAGADGETVGIALVDEDGDLATAAGWIAVAYRTASGGASVVSQVAGDPEVDEPVGGATSALDVTIYPPPGQIGASFAAALADPYDGSIVGGGFVASGAPTTGSRRLVLAAECNTDTDTGPHPVRVRVWYVWIPVREVAP